jgi:hypothetical protein
MAEGREDIAVGAEQKKKKAMTNVSLFMLI